MTIQSMGEWPNRIKPGAGIPEKNQLKVPQILGSHVCVTLRRNSVFSYAPQNPALIDAKASKISARGASPCDGRVRELSRNQCTLSAP